MVKNKKENHDPIWIHDQKLERARSDQSITERKYKEVLQDNERLARERDAALGIRSAPIRPVQIKASFGAKESEAVAVAIASDWHVEEEIRPETVHYKNAYNLSIAEIRAKQFFERTARLIRKEKQDVKIKHLVLGLLGDFITGRLHEENLETCLLRPMDASLFAQDLIIGGIKFLLENTDVDILVIGKIGNHSRITKKIHHSTEAGNSLEWMMYHNIAQYFSGEKRLRFILEESYHTYVNIFGKVLRFHHGHRIGFGGGVGGLTIPLQKAIYRWNLTMNADMDILGHFHTYMPMPRFTVNGSMIGYNAFATAIKSEFEPPSQSFFLIDKARGKTVSMPILFDQ